MAFYLISIQRGDKGFWVSVSFSKGRGALLSGFSVLGEGTSWAWVLHGRRPLWDLSLSLTQESSVEYLRYFSEYSKIYVCYLNLSPATKIFVCISENGL